MSIDHLHRTVEAIVVGKTETLSLVSQTPIGKQSRLVKEGAVELCVTLDVGGESRPELMASREQFDAIKLGDVLHLRKHTVRREYVEVHFTWPEDVDG